MWKNGKKHGIATEWFEDGKKGHEIYYFRGKESAPIGWSGKETCHYNKVSEFNEVIKKAASMVSIPPPAVTNTISKLN